MTTGQSNYSNSVNLIQYSCHSESGSVFFAQRSPGVIRANKTEVDIIFPAEDVGLGGLKAGNESINSMSSVLLQINKSKWLALLCFYFFIAQS